MYRLAHLIDGTWIEHSHPATFELPTPDGSQRITAGLPASDIDVILRLARVLSEPLILLYVLHTPRGEAEPGRYQSPPLTLQEVETFLREFREFMASDGRFDLWIYAPEERATVVWDRHNMIYAYGPLDAYTQAFRALGFTQGQAQVPLPHAHHYRSEFDELASKLIIWFDWQHSPLRPEDEQ